MYEIYLQDFQAKTTQPTVEAVIHRLDPEAEVSFDLLASKVRVQSVVPQDKLETELESSGVGIARH